MSGARPLERGEHAFGVTVGGAMLDFGGSPLPLPNTVVEGAHGLTELDGKPVDLRYGLNATGLPFGVLSGHVGSSWLLVEPNGAVPRLSLTNRLWFATNVPGLAFRTEPVVQGWLTWQPELTASYDVGQQLVYVSASQYLDVMDPGLTFTPALGAQLDPGKAGGFFVQPEVRWFAAGRVRDSRGVRFIGPSGAFGASVAFGTRFGGPR